MTAGSGVSRVVRVLVVATATTFLATACGSDPAEPEASPVTCAEIPNGEMIDAQTMTAAPTDIATRPEVASGFRTGMRPVVTDTYAAATANPLATRAAYRVMRGANREGGARMFRAGQTVSASFVALAHGTSDGQKTMGVITLVLVTGGYQASGTGPHLWVIVAAGLAIGLGTYSGGWRIMRTLGRRIIHLDPARGFAAESVAASVLYTTAYAFEAPISTTHTITSAVMGVGATKRLSAVRWGVARSIVTAWVLTFPMAALAAALCYWFARIFLP